MGWKPRTKGAVACVGRLKGSSAQGLRGGAYRRPPSLRRRPCVCPRRREVGPAPRASCPSESSMRRGEFDLKCSRTGAVQEIPANCGFFLRWDRRNGQRTHQAKELEAPIERLRRLRHLPELHAVGHAVGVVRLGDVRELRDVAPVADEELVRCWAAPAEAGYRKSRCVTYCSTFRAVASVPSGPARWRVMDPSENPVSQAVE